MQQTLINNKVFTIDYSVLGDPRRRFRSYMTTAASRKDAENKTRELETPEKIHVFKIKSYGSIEEINEGSFDNE